MTPSDIASFHVPSAKVALLRRSSYRPAGSRRNVFETARANNCEPFSYLRHIFTRLPGAQTLADYEARLPWNLDRARIMLFTVEGGD